MTSKRRLIDTNIIIRHLVQDHERHSKAASKLIAASDQGSFILIILPAVLAETVFVLESFYKHSRVDIARTLSALICSRNIELADAPIHLGALSRYASTKLHFVDCTLAATAATRDIPIATFDGEFSRLKDVVIALD